MTDPTMRLTDAVPVEIKNWPDPPAKNPIVKNTVLRTYLLSTTGDGTQVQISDYEPKRARMVIVPIDAPITVLDSIPSTSPDSSIAGTKPSSGGAVLVNGVIAYELFGPDALWINRLATDTRVTVIKEFFS